MPNMAERIYQHYLEYGKSKGKKLTRRKFRKRYNSRLRKKSLGTQSVEGGLRRGQALEERDIARFSKKKR